MTQTGVAPQLAASLQLGTADEASTLCNAIPSSHLKTAKALVPTESADDNAVIEFPTKLSAVSTLPASLEDGPCAMLYDLRTNRPLPVEMLAMLEARGELTIRRLSFAGPARVDGFEDFSGVQYFRILVSGGDTELLVLRRYSHFEALRDRLVVDAPQTAAVLFPPKLLRHTSSALQERAVALDTWLRGVRRIGDNNPAIRSLLDAFLSDNAADALRSSTREYGACLSDCVPGVSQCRALYLWAAGDGSAAVGTQVTFANRFPVLSQLKSLYEGVYLWDGEQAFRTQAEFLRGISTCCSSIPLVGHTKGVLQIASGDTHRGVRTAAAATRGTGYVAYGAIGSITGGIMAWDTAPALASGSVNFMRCLALQTSPGFANAVCMPLIKLGTPYLQYDILCGAAVGGVAGIKVAEGGEKEVWHRGMLHDASLPTPAAILQPASLNSPVLLDSVTDHTRTTRDSSWAWDASWEDAVHVTEPLNAWRVSSHPDATANTSLHMSVD